MRETLFRGKGDKRYNDSEWYLGVPIECYDGDWQICTDSTRRTVIPETIGQYAELPDKNGKMIFEGDIVKYSTFDGFDCRSIVKFGLYKQDGSNGEYKASNCLGFYIELNNFTCPDWCDEPEMFHDYLKQQSLAEIASQCEVIGNIYDNPELIGGRTNE